VLGNIVKQPHSFSISILSRLFAISSILRIILNRLFPNQGWTLLKTPFIFFVPSKECDKKVIEVSNKSSSGK